MERMVFIFGSNSVTPVSAIEEGVRSLSRFSRVVARSSFYVTEPVGREGLPWFVNHGVLAETGNEPEEILYAIKEIEKEAGRLFSSSYLPRPLDVDIAAGTVMVKSGHLQIPHPRLKERLFMLAPIQEIAPEMDLTGKGERAADLIRLLPSGERVVRL